MWELHLTNSEEKNWDLGRMWSAGKYAASSMDKI